MSGEMVSTDLEVEAAPSDAVRAQQIRQKFEELCELLDQMHEWEVTFRLDMDDIGRWKSNVGFRKTVTL